MKGVYPMHTVHLTNPKRFVVVVERGKWERFVWGVYRSFKSAEGDAKAWGGYVLPLMKPEEGFYKVKEEKA
jgi:hypothetical protein